MYVLLRAVVCFLAAIMSGLLLNSPIPLSFFFAALSGQPLSAPLQAAAGRHRAEGELAAAREDGVDFLEAAAQPPAAPALPLLPADHSLPAH